MTDIIRIAALDPGITTGLAIADVKILDDFVVLQRVCLMSTLQPLEASRKVVRSNCYSIVIERRPMYASREGTENYETILRHLELNEYKDNRHWMVQPHSIAMFSPGIWKPVMKAQKIESLGNWQPQTQHEKDALNLLHYAVKLNNMNKEVQYG